MTLLHIRRRKTRQEFTQPVFLIYGGSMQELLASCLLLQKNEKEEPCGGDTPLHAQRRKALCFGVDLKAFGHILTL